MYIAHLLGFLIYAITINALTKSMNSPLTTNNSTIIFQFIKTFIMHFNENTNIIMHNEPYPKLRNKAKWHLYYGDICTTA